MSPSTLELFDEYVRTVEAIKQADCRAEFLTFVRNQNQCRLQWKAAVDECQRLRCELDNAVAANSELERKLTRSRHFLQQEREQANALELERDKLHEQLDEIQKIIQGIYRDGDRLANETREKLDRFLNDTGAKLRRSAGDSLYPKLETIDECNFTADMLSDVSTHDSDSMSVQSSDRSAGRRKSKKPRKSEVMMDEVPVKRRRSARLSAYNITSNEHLVATTTVTVQPDGPITAQSRIDARPIKSVHSDGASSVFLHPSAPPPASTTSASDSEAPSTPRKAAFTRAHDFTYRTILRPGEECCACMKSMGFASKSVRCAECKSCAHIECRDLVPIPCIPVVATPRGERLKLVDQVGTTPPLIPPLVLRCVLEVESRGLLELGIYRVPGSEKDVRALRAKFQRVKGAWSLASFDIHVICGVLKDFLRSLPEPLITHAQWRGFAEAIHEPTQSRDAALYQQVSDLPAPNRDTLAFMMLHLLKVAQSPDCKMSVMNLATVFGPTLAGFSSPSPTNADITQQTPLQAMIVENLIQLGEDYWRNILQKVPKTPLLTPKYSFRSRSGSKTQRLFGTPA